MLGQDVVMWLPWAAVCSSVVSAVVSLFSPFAYGGEFRPYINPYDANVNLLANACRDKYRLTQAPSDAGSIRELYEKRWQYDSR
jgi:hypothetical protein